MDPSRGPQTIGRYQVVSRLGKGAMGVVFSARDERLGRDVAIKIMNAGLDDEPDSRARFFREAQVTSRLLHRNIVTVFDLGEESGRPFIVMELVKGRTLTQALQEPVLDTLEAKLDVMIQLCEGLSKAHAAGVVHRDIKPSNLFLQPDGSLKILDFGIARLASSNMTRTGLVVGTPDYMSPEQARGGEIDERSDIFSVAAVCYFMLTRRRPFAGPDIATAIRRVIQENPEPMTEAEAPAPLAAIIMRALNKDQGLRYQRCLEMAADLVRFRRNFDTETRRMGSLVRAQFDEAKKVAASIRSLQQDSGLAPAEWFESQSRELDETPTLPSRRAQLAELNAGIAPIVQKLAAELARLKEEQAQSIAAAEAARQREEQRAQAAIAARTQVARALQHLAAGRFESAVQEADNILQLVPDFSRAVAVRTLALRLISATAATKERLAAARKREQDVARLVSGARTALAAGQTASALRDAESAVALDPAHADATLILDHVQSVLALMAGDEYEMPSIPPQEASTAGLARLVGQAGDVVSDVTKRLSERLRGRRS